MAIFRTLGRLRYDDRPSDFIQDFPTKTEAQDHLKNLGFIKTEEIGQVTYFYLPAVDGRNQPTKLAGYLVEVR